MCMCVFVCVCLSLCVSMFVCMCVADVKQQGAGRRSQYYRKYGNPNFGGETSHNEPLWGLSSSSSSSGCHCGIYRVAQNKPDYSTFQLSLW